MHLLFYIFNPYFFAMHPLSPYVLFLCNHVLPLNPRPIPPPPLYHSLPFYISLYMAVYFVFVISGIDGIVWFVLSLNQTK